jgi:hypothetical protein
MVLADRKPIHAFETLLIVSVIVFVHEPLFPFPLQVHGLLQQGLVEEATAVANALLETGADGSSVPSEAYTAFQTQAAHVCLSQMKFADAMAFFLAAGTDPVEVYMQGAIPLPFCFAFCVSRAPNSAARHIMRYPTLQVVALYGLHAASGSIDSGVGPEESVVHVMSTSSGLFSPSSHQ